MNEYEELYRYIIMLVDEQEVFMSYLIDLLQSIFWGNGSMDRKTEQADRKEPRFKLGNGFYFEFNEASNGYGGYRMINVYLLKTDDTSFRRCIVNGNGRIENFPGIEKGEWTKKLEYPLNNKVQFRFWIYEYKDGKASVEWTLQPDGRYFEDEDGFGGENCEEITLYSYIDTNGKFTEPFKHR